MDERLERFASALAEIPAWLAEPAREPGLESPEAVLGSLAEKSFIGKRYRRLVVDEGRYWSRVATDLIARHEIPRWADHRRFEAEYNHLGKGAWVELYRVLFGGPLRRILAAAAAAAGPILELGCGCGWLSLEMARLGRNVAGVDASPDEIALARFFDENRHRHAEDVRRPFYGFRPAPADRQGAITYTAADLNDASLPAGPFALAVSWESLHHFQNLAGLSAAVRRALSPDGLFLVHETIHEELTGSRLRKVLTSPPVLRALRLVPGEKGGRPIHEFEPELFEAFGRAFRPEAAGARDILDSPFEGATGEAMESILAEDFEILGRIPRHHALTEAGGFQVLEDWTAKLGRPPSRVFVRWIFRAVKLADDFAVRLLGKRPRHVFLVLKPKPAASSAAPSSLRERVGRRTGRVLENGEWASALERLFRRVIRREDRFEEDLDVFSFLSLFPEGIKLAGARDELLLAGGWYIKEGDYRWTNGSAGIYLVLPRGTRGLEVEVMGFPGARPESPQPLVFRSRGGDLARFKVEKSGWHILRAPTETLSEEVDVVRVESPTFNPRKDLGEEDGRDLGVALRAIRFLT